MLPPSVESSDAELKASHDVIFHHPNVGPFVCRQLFQRMVTANPSPGYIYRVASAFADNGSGVRGDLKAVVRAILLDPEARNAAPRNQPGFGKLKEPVLRASQVLRAFHDDDVVHVEGRVSPEEDMETINTELILADLQTLENAIPRLTKEARNDKTKAVTLAAAEQAAQAAPEAD